MFMVTSSINYQYKLICRLSYYNQQITCTKDLPDYLFRYTGPRTQIHASYSTTLLRSSNLLIGSPYSFLPSYLSKIEGTLIYTNAFTHIAPTNIHHVSRCAEYRASLYKRTSMLQLEICKSNTDLNAPAISRGWNPYSNVFESFCYEHYTVTDVLWRLK